MRRRTPTKARLLPDGTPLHNRLLASLPAADYARLVTHLRLRETTTGDTIHEEGGRIKDVYFPNGGVFSITNHMRDGSRVEVATVGREGMLGLGVFLGDRAAGSRTFQQVADGPVAALSVRRFLEEAAPGGPLHDVVARYAQATLLQSLQCIACNALHGVRERCCRWLLQTHDRVGADDLPLKQEFLAFMLGVRRPTVTVVLHTLQEAGLISSRYGCIRVLRRARIEAASCECYGVIQGHFARLGL